MSNRLNCEVKPNGRFIRFLTRPVEIEKVFVPKAVMVSEIARVEDYFEVEYPVRTAFLKANDLDLVSYKSEGFSMIYTPFEKDRIDFSNFISTPHKIFTYAKTSIYTPETADVRFKLRTCGAVIIWVNGKREVVFSPYTRNHYSEKKITLPLMEGDNEIVVYFEDLAERDVNFYFELINDQSYPLNSWIDMAIGCDDYQDVENILFNAYLEKDLFNEGEVLLHFKGKTRQKDYPLLIKVNPKQSLVEDGAQDGNITDFTVNDISLLLKKDQDVLSIGQVQEIPTAGFTRLELSIPLDKDIKIARVLTCSIYDESKLSSIITGSTLSERKEEAKIYYSQLQLEDINVLLVNAALNQIKDNDIYADYRSAFRLIEEKGDCADFILAPLLAVYHEYKGNFPDDFHPRMLELSKDFRYWIDEPGNDVMWYFSENHALLFHVSQYLAGYIYPDETFTASDRLGKEQYEIGKARLEDWFEKFFEVGFSEWNSTTYFPIDLIGFFSLYLSAPDENIKQLAAKALDETFTLIAINYHGGTMASSYGRVYEHNLKAMKLGEISSVIEIAWKEGYFNNSLRAGALFALTDYEPPEHLEELLCNDINDVLTASYLQGDNKAQTYLYKQKHYSLGSVINYKPYQRGHQQHVINVSLGDCTMLWMNNPGESEFSGGNRPSYWAGNDAMPLVYQYKNTAFMHYDLSAVDYKFVHLYVPFWDLDAIVELDNWVFIRKNQSYLAVYFSNPHERTKLSAIYDREIKSKGEQHHLIVTVSSEDESGSFEAFMNTVTAVPVLVEKDTLTYVDSQHDVFTFGKELKRNDRQVTYQDTYKISYQKQNRRDV